MSERPDGWIEIGQPTLNSAASCSGPFNEPGSSELLWHPCLQTFLMDNPAKTGEVHGDIPSRMWFSVFALWPLELRPTNQRCLRPALDLSQAQKMKGEKTQCLKQRSLGSDIYMYVLAGRVWGKGRRGQPGREKAAEKTNRNEAAWFACLCKNTKELGFL